jgi:hypothetical protein
MLQLQGYGKKPIIIKETVKGKQWAYELHKDGSKSWHPDLDKKKPQFAADTSKNDDIDAVHNLDGQGNDWFHAILRGIFGRGERKERIQPKADTYNVFEPPRWARDKESKRKHKERVKK